MSTEAGRGSAELLARIRELEDTLERVLIDYAVTVDGEWGKCRHPRKPGWDEFFAEFKAEALSTETEPWWADEPMKEEE